MSAGKYNFVIEQGTTFTRTITWKDSSGSAIDLSTYTARMDIKEKKSDTTANALVNLTETAGLTLGGGAGTILITITHAVTTALDFEEAYYDLEVKSAGGVVTKLLEGTITLDKEVTTAAWA